MSARVRAPARPGRGDTARRARVLVFLVPLLASLAGGVASAGPPGAVSRLSAKEAEDAGQAVALISHRLASGAAVEVRLPLAAPGVRLLAMARDGSSAALADRYGVDPAALVLARPDGSQARLQMPGLLAAGYAPAGDWLAAIDGRGALWQVDAASGDARALADGPFLGSPLVQPDGSILLLSVSSVEAPFVSQLVRLDPETGGVEPLADEQLVYAAFPMDDGTIAIAAHEAGATVVRRISGTRDELIADLGPGATQVAVATNGRIAFVREGRGVFLLDRPGAVARPLAAGGDPAFDRSGSVLIVRQVGSTLVLAPDGSPIARFPGDAVFVACGQECGS